MRHSWKIEIKEKFTVIEKRKRSEDKIHRLKHIYECVNCGLRKGYSNLGTGWNSYQVLIYFDKEGNYLSSNLLPFKCLSLMKKDLFLDKGDFYIE